MVAPGAEPNTGADLLALAQSQPQKVIDQTEELPDWPSVAACHAARARGIALRILDRNDEALDALQHASRLARALDDRLLEAGCLRSIAPIEALLGQLDKAAATLDLAERRGGVATRADVEFQRAGLALIVADWRRSHAHYSTALDLYRDADNADWVAASLLGRGLMAAYIGDRAGADADLDEARRRFEQAGDAVGVGQTMWNHALATALVGEPARAVVLFAAASDHLEAAGFPVDLFLADQAEALFTVGLHEEAITLATRCVDAYAAEAAHTTGSQRRRNVLDAASRRLELARIHALTGQLDEAIDHATRARSEFLEQRQTLRAFFAELVALDCQSRQDPAPRVAERAGELRRELIGHRQPEWLATTRLIEARCALAEHDTHRAASVLATLSRSERSPIQELSRLELSARTALADGAPGRALRQARRARRAVQHGPRLVGSSWVDAASTRQLEPVAEIGLGVLLAQGAARKALAFAADLESAGTITSLHPGHSSELFTEYRALTRAIDEAKNELRDPTPIEVRRDEVGRRIRVARTAVADSDSDHDDTAQADAAVPVALARWFIIDDHAWLVVDRGRRAHVWSLGPPDEIAETLDETAFLLRRAFRSPTPRRLEALADAAADADAALGHVGSRFPRLGPGPLHLMPAPQLPATVFGLFPSLRSIDWVVTRRQSGRISRPQRPSRVGVLGGPDLSHAAAELAGVADMHPHATVDEQASCHSAIAALEQCDLCHVTAHSALNEGNPMFSSIRFADGALPLYELEDLRVRPRTAVLASCESARDQQVGLERIGIASALNTAGIDVVIGTALPIPDTDGTVATMTALHRALLEHDSVVATNRLANYELDPLGRLIADVLVTAVRAPVTADRVPGS